MNSLNDTMALLQARASRGDARAAAALRQLRGYATPSQQLGIGYAGPGALPSVPLPAVRGRVGYAGPNPRPIVTQRFSGARPSVTQSFGAARQSGARSWIVAGQKLTAAQIAELIAMMQLAAMGIGPIVANAPPGGATTAAPPGGDGGGGLGAMKEALNASKKEAQARADAAALAKAYAKANTDAALRNAMLSQANLSFARENASTLNDLKTPVAAAPYTGPSMSDTGVGPNVTWAKGEIQPYAQPGLASDTGAFENPYWYNS